MECKFLDHGLALAYQETVKPCCLWQFDSEYKNSYQLDITNLDTFHQQPDIVNARNLLSKGIWPKNCELCQLQEVNGRQDSVRLGGLNSYADYNNNDLTLEIRPGSVCNFACQTCWPAASSRVANYYNQIKFEKEKKIYLTSVDTESSTTFKNFDFLLPVANRLKSVVLLGGEPFYDKNCLNFIHWWNQNTSADLTVFTNGSNLPFEFLEQIKNPITLVFSLDAVGRPAEYIRFGTKWNEVWENFCQARKLPNVKIRVNITQSVYSYEYISQILKLLIQDWPEVVTFGQVFEPHFSERVVPTKFRSRIIKDLEKTTQLIEQANIEDGQKHNAINALSSTISNLESANFDIEQFEKFKNFVKQIDAVKKIDIRLYCPEVAEYIY